MKKLFLMLAVVAAAASCAKESANNEQTGPDRELAIRIMMPSKLNETRADNAIAVAASTDLWLEGDNDGSSYVFVLNNLDNVIKCVELVAEAKVSDFTQSNAQYLGLLPSNVKIYVVGNVLSTHKNQVKALTTLADIKKFAMDMKDYDFTNYTHPIYVNENGNAVTPVTTGANNTFGTLQGHTNDTSIEDWVANIKIAPAFARIELHSVQAETKAEAIIRRNNIQNNDNTANVASMGYVTGFKVAGVYVDDVFFKTTYGAYGVGDNNSGTSTQPASLAQDLANFSAWTTAGFGHTTASIGSIVLDIDDEHLVAMEYFNTTSKQIETVWSFNVPAKSAGHLIVALSDIKYKLLSDSDSDPEREITGSKYLTVTGYTNAEGGAAGDAELKAGTVYQLGTDPCNWKNVTNPAEFEFTLDNIFDTPNPQDVEVYMKIKMLDWEFAKYNPILHGSRK